MDQVAGFENQNAGQFLFLGTIQQGQGYAEHQNDRNDDRKERGEEKLQKLLHKIQE